MTLPDPVRRAFEHHSAAAKQPTAKWWRAWSRYLEPVLVGVFVLLFVAWAFAKVLR